MHCINWKIKCIFEIEFTAFEVSVIQATGSLQEELKCPVSFHPGRHASSPSEILRLYSEAGGDCKKAVMSHLDSKSVSSLHILKVI